MSEESEAPGVRRLSDAEWRVMLRVWSLGGDVTVREVAQELRPEDRVAEAAVRTLLGRIVEKGYLDVDSVAARDVLPEAAGYELNIYSVRVSKEEALLLEFDWIVHSRLEDDAELVDRLRAYLKEWEPGAPRPAFRYRRRSRTS